MITKKRLHEIVKATDKALDDEATVIHEEGSEESPLSGMLAELIDALVFERKERIKESDRESSYEFDSLVLLYTGECDFWFEVKDGKTSEATYLAQALHELGLDEVYVERSLAPTRREKPDEHKLEVPR